MLPSVTSEFGVIYRWWHKNEKLKTVLASAFIVFAHPVFSQDLPTMPTSEIVAEISYLNSIRQSVQTLGSSDARSLVEVLTQVAVCDDLNYEEFAAFSDRMDAALGQIRNYIQLGSVSGLTYEDRFEQGCSVERSDYNAVSSLFQSIQVMVRINDLVDERQLELARRFFSDRGASPIDSLLESMADLPVRE